jgi:hypothetical protein
LLALVAVEVQGQQQTQELQELVREQQVQQLVDD